MSNQSAEEVLFEGLAAAVVEMDSAAAARLAQEVVDSGLHAHAAVERGLNRGMERVGELFSRHEYYVPEMLLAADAMYAALEVLKPHLSAGGCPVPGTVVLGVIEGDNHDIGKNLVKAVLEASGFDVVDLGSNVPIPQFIQAARENGADVVAISTLMTTTMDRMGAAVAGLKAERLHRDRLVIVGGAPVSADFASRIGADSYAPDAVAAVREIREMLRRRG